jgi:hypothetical protein
MRAAAGDRRRRSRRRQNVARRHVTCRAGTRRARLGFSCCVPRAAALCALPGATLLRPLRGLPSRLRRVLRRGLLDNGYLELPVTSEHAVSVDTLPALHKDPFDRILLAQALVEGITLLTSDEQLARYRGPVRKV